MSNLKIIISKKMDLIVGKFAILVFIVASTAFLRLI